MYVTNNGKLHYLLIKPNKHFTKQSTTVQFYTQIYVMSSKSLIEKNHEKLFPLPLLKIPCRAGDGTFSVWISYRLS